MTMDRRRFLRTGALWTLGATIITPDFLERLTWRRRFWPSATISDDDYLASLFRANDYVAIIPSWQGTDIHTFSRFVAADDYAFQATAVVRDFYAPTGTLSLLQSPYGRRA